MEPNHLPRKLVAVFYADVVGYSRLTAEDEESTYRRLRKHLDEITNTIKQHNGRVTNYAGDAVLGMFDSATNALICAIQIQKTLKVRNADIPDDRKINFRIGLNLGDVIEDKGDIFGGGVNIAARLEGIAKPSGICVSGSFYDAIGHKSPYTFENRGEQQVKNISEPVRAYYVWLKENTALPDITRKPRYYIGRDRYGVLAILLLVVITAIAFAEFWQPWSSDSPGQTTVQNTIPSIIVLPFSSKSNNPQQDYFSDGITEDMITDLSRFSNLQVMARNTSFRYKNQNVDPLKIYEELGVKYILGGSIRQAGGQIRMNVRLVNSESGYQVWAERYDGKQEDIFAVQDEVARSIVKVLSINLSNREEALLRKAASDDFEAYNLFLSGQQSFRERTKEANKEAQDKYMQAIRLDPEYARAYSAFAVAVAIEVRRGWADSPTVKNDRALELAKKALVLDDSLPQAYWALSYTHLGRHEFTEAADVMKQGLAIAPSYADGYGLLGLISNSLGDSEMAIDYIKKGMRLNPYYTWDYPYNLGRAYYTLKRYPEAIRRLLEALERNENAFFPRVFLAACFAQSGQLEDAEWEVEQLRVQNPSMTLSDIARTIPFSKPEFSKALLEDLRKAGLPE